MMHARWLALPLAVSLGLGTGCASMTGPATGPRLLSSDLHVGALDQRTSFELDDGGSPGATTRDAPDDRVDTPDRQRRRKILYYTGLGAIGIGGLGILGFGIGGRIVQAQVQNGYEDGTLTFEREDQLRTTGTVMNGLAIGSAVVGLAGVILSATVYGIDHARCGDLPPRRKDCRGEPTAGAPAAGPTPGQPEQGAPGQPEPGPGPSQEAPGQASPQPAPGGAGGGGAGGGGAGGGGGGAGGGGSTAGGTAGK